MSYLTAVISLLDGNYNSARAAGNVLVYKMPCSFRLISIDIYIFYIRKRRREIRGVFVMQSQIISGISKILRFRIEK